MVGAIRAGLEEVETKAITWDKVKPAAEGDQTSQDLIQVIRHGFPEQNNMLDDNLR